MQLDTTRITVTEFDQIAAAPENADRLLEFVAGEIVEVLSNPSSSAISALLSHYLLGFVLAKI